MQAIVLEEGYAFKRRNDIIASMEIPLKAPESLSIALFQCLYLSVSIAVFPFQVHELNPPAPQSW